MYSQQLHDIGMIQLFQYVDLSIRSFGISLVLESVKDLFECHDSASPTVNGFPDVPVGPTAHLLNQLETLQDVFFDFFAHFLKDYKKEN